MAAMQLAVVPVTPFQQNCSVLWCERSRAAAIIDPGGELERVLAVVARHGLTLSKILLTHAHLDHCGGTAELARRCGVPIEGPQRGDAFWIEGLPEQAAQFGLPPAEAFEPTRWLEHGDRVQLGEGELEVLHCPGHTPGHVVFFDRPDRLAIVGDVLFQGSIGRTDFPGGDYDTLIRSIRERLFPLGDDVRFLPGHGPMSTFGAERHANAFVADRLFR
jgi:glyoxylase-like metal-dependent hydrolase (beta-lactamase superfamily II)